MNQQKFDKASISFRGMSRGALEMAPIAAFTVPFGFAFGIAANNTTLSGLEVIVMSASVFAAASQFAALEIWGATVPALPLVLIVLAVNARFILMGAALYPWFSELNWSKRIGSLLMLSQANFASSLSAYESGEREVGIFIGGGLAIWVAWLVGTVGVSN